MFSVKPLLGILLLLGLGACATLPPVDVGLRTTGQVGASVAILSERVPLRLPVAVVDAPLLESGLFGQAHNLGDHYLILLDASIDENLRVSVLLHEWAHLLVWDEGAVSETSHGDAWAIRLGRVFRAWVGEESPDSP